MKPVHRQLLALLLAVVLGSALCLSLYVWYNKNRLGGKSRFSGVSRLSCYYRVNSSVFIGL